MNNLRKLVEQCSLEKVGITAEGCASLLRTYADVIPKKLAKIFDELELIESAAAARELRAHMEEPITQLCERTKASLQS